MSVNQIEGLWSPEEDQMLLNFIEEHGINWSLISKSIPGRSDLSCWSRWLSVQRSFTPEEDETNLIEGPWSFEEDEMLLYCAWEHDRNWLLVRESMPGRSGLSCMSRWLTLQRSFTPEEDEMVLNLVEKHSHNWSLVISESIPGRSGLSCVSRWISLCRAYTPEEDQMLLNLFMEHGRNWSVISESIPGRSALSCELRWSLLAWKGISSTNEDTTIGAHNSYVPPPTFSAIGHGQGSSYVPDGNISHVVGGVSDYQAPSISAMVRVNTSAEANEPAPSWNALNKQDPSQMIANDNVQGIRGGRVWLKRIFGSLVKKKGTVTYND